MIYKYQIFGFEPIDCLILFIFYQNYQFIIIIKPLSNSNKDMFPFQNNPNQQNIYPNNYFFPVQQNSFDLSQNPRLYDPEYMQILYENLALKKENNELKQKNLKL